MRDNYVKKTQETSVIKKASHDGRLAFCKFDI